MIVDTNNILIMLGSITFGVYSALLYSSFYHDRLNGFKASAMFTWVVLLIILCARVFEETLIPIFYGQIMVYVALLLNAYTLYRAMASKEVKIDGQGGEGTK